MRSGCGWNVTLRLIGTVTKKVVFHLAREVLACTGISQIQAVFVHEHGLVLEPGRPGFFAHAFPNAFTQLARVGWKIQAFGLFVELDTVDGTCHVRNLAEVSAASSKGAILFDWKTMVKMVWNWIGNYPQRVLLAMALASVGLLAFGFYLQHVVGLEPCPMCIVQRYALFLIVLVAVLAGATSRKGLNSAGAFLMVLLGGGGAFVAARQSWLQWYPPEVVTCGRDFYGMVENFPLNRAIPMIFKGSGDCTKIDWTFLGGSIANWSFLWFVAIAAASLLVAVRSMKAR